MFDAIVIGGQSAANGQPKVCPEAEWVTELIIAAKRDGCKVFVKTNHEYRPVELPRSPSVVSNDAGGAKGGLVCLVAPDGPQESLIGLLGADHGGLW